MTCKHCGSNNLKKSDQICSNGMVHLRVDCADCGKFQQYEKRNGNGRKWTPREITPPSPEWTQKCSAFVDWAYAQLLNNTGILSYLRSERGLTLDTIKLSRLGWNPVGLNRERVFWGLPEKLKEDGTQQDIWLPQGIVIPYFADGILQRAKIRRLNQQSRTPEQGPAYAIVSGSTSAAMIPTEPHQVIVVVESEFDAILLTQELGNMASPLAGVVALGSASVRPDKRAFELLQAADLILVALDSDEDREDGQNPGAKEAQWWMQHFPQARRLPPIEGKDPGEMWVNGVELQEWIAIGINKYFPQAHEQKHRQTRKSLDIAAPIQVPIIQQLDNIDEKDFSGIMAAISAAGVEAYDRTLTCDCYTWIEKNRPDFIKTWQEDFAWIAEVYDLVMAGRLKINDFIEAYNLWQGSWVEALKVYREVQNL